jgi:uncharacterized protein YggE
MSLRNTFVVAATALAVAAAVSVPAAMGQSIGVSSQQAQGISVVGEGVVTATPNIARITLGVEVINASLNAAQADAANKMDAVVNTLKAAGVAESDIKTVNYTVNPLYDFRDNQNVLRGYQVQNMVEVRVTNLPGLGPLIDGVVASGASRIYGIRFESDNPSALKDQARDLAMQNAKAKAEQLARGAGVSLGRPIYIEESDTGGVTPVRAELSAAPAADGGRSVTPVQPGEMQVRTTVRVVWGIL